VHDTDGQTTQAMNAGLVPLAGRTPVLAAAAGERASYRFFEFFTAQIRNPNTRRAYARAAVEFFDWLAAHGVTQITAIESVHVAAYIEQLQKTRSAPTAKLRLAALRHLFDWMVIGQIMPLNPASAVRGPRHIVRRGKTPVLDPAEARQLIDAINTSTVIGLRDRALIGLMVYSFARIGAAIGMRVEDVYPQNRRLWLRLQEKGGKQHAMPCHHNLEAYLHEYLDGAGLANEPKAMLFQTYSRATGRLTGNPLPQANAYEMIQRRAKAAGISTQVGNHTFRATGVTAYLKNGGTLEKAAQMANHASTRTTQLYDRRAEEVTLDEVERVMI
jgi:site-specific recombinase XerD